MKSREREARRRIAIDLDDTLIDTRKTRQQGVAVLRPGARRLLTALQQEGHELVLYSTASRPWANLLFEKHPDLKGAFSNIITRENMPKHDLGKIDDDDERAFLRELDHGHAGGKDPNLIGADVLIDDYINPEAQRRLGFKAIKVPHPNEDATNGWVSKVLEELREL